MEKVLKLMIIVAINRLENMQLFSF